MVRTQFSNLAELGSFDKFIATPTKSLTQRYYLRYLQLDLLD